MTPHSRELLLRNYIEGGWLRTALMYSATVEKAPFRVWFEFHVMADWRWSTFRYLQSHPSGTTCHMPQVIDQSFIEPPCSNPMFV